METKGRPKEEQDDEDCTKGRERKLGKGGKGIGWKKEEEDENAVPIHFSSYFSWIHFSIGKMEEEKVFD